MPSVEFNLAGKLRFLVEEEITSLVTLRFDNFTVAARGDTMAYTLPVDHVVKVHVAYVDSHGNPAGVDSEVSWASSDETIARVVVDETDSANASVEAQAKLGQAQITATADADIGEGVRELVTLMDVSVIAGEAVAGTISPVGEPIPPSAQPV
jgi:hypothetical protein